jgi:hypothetical protein
MAIRRSDRQRLARLAGPRIHARRNEVERRVERRELVAEFEHIEALLRLEGVDPESTCVMRRLRQAEAELAAIPDTQELQRADAEYLARTDMRWIDAQWERNRRYRPPPREEKTFESEVERLIGRYRTDCQIDFAKASPFDLFAWCLSRHGATDDEAAADVATAAEDLLLLSDALPDDATPEAIERALLAAQNQ